MLILSRKPGESIRIGDSITVELLELRGDKARLGITAPRDVKVLRDELLDAPAPATPPAIAAPDQPAGADLRQPATEGQPR